MVKLENDYIEVYVLPEAGGKVWGAIEKKSGREFIYRNEVMKFRNIALRGPWTSGGIEFNFGVIGHTPSTATPVDYKMVDNTDGSVSVFVGAMDLPSRTSWRVEVRLPAGVSYFETNAYWNNPTSLVQPYYNWMTAAAFAQNDLEMAIPGNQYLKHSGEALDWPTDRQGRYLPAYANNTYEGHKSFHVVGEYNDFFGGYYTEDDYGFGHWARFEDQPGQKLWLWANSRQGGIWEDLLTDTDGQYVEYQAGRMLVQYSPASHANPITKAGFAPLTTDMWSERWFPVMQTGGLSDASDLGAMHVSLKNDSLHFSLNAFASMSGDFSVDLNGDVHKASFDLQPLDVSTYSYPFEAGGSFTISVPDLDLEYSSDNSHLSLSRPFDLNPSARPSMTGVERNIFEGRELMKARRYEQARRLFESALMAEKWNRDALVELASLDLREARYEEGIAHVFKALQMDAHDADANFIAGALHQAIGQELSARDYYSWAARSMAYRSSANARIAELALKAGRAIEAIEFANRSLDYDRYNVTAMEILALADRDSEVALARIEEADPLNHFARAERFLRSDRSRDWKVFSKHLHAEFSDQTVLETAIRYSNLGLIPDAIALLERYRDDGIDPMLLLWEAYLSDSPELLNEALDLPISNARPYRPESLPALDWAIETAGKWNWSYLKGLNYWALNRPSEALSLWTDLADMPDHAAFYVARGRLAETVREQNPEADLLKALTEADANRIIHIEVVQHFQSKSDWARALDHSGSALEMYPDDFNLQMLHARSLLFLSQASDAIAILENIQVLPSENARESHFLFESAHLMRAIQLFNQSKPDEAMPHVERALEWPEHLGQGRPYDPDERLATYLVYRIADRNGNSAASDVALQYLVEQSRQRLSTPSALNLLGVDVLRRTGQIRQAEELDKQVRARMNAVEFSLTDILVENAVAMKTPDQ